MNEFAATLQDTLRQFWEDRAERERQYLTVAALFVVLALIYLIGIEPALTGREELKRALPVLRQQSAQMHQMAQELAAIPSAENRHEVTRELIESALTGNALKAQTLSVNDGTVRAQFAGVALSGLQGWLLELQKSSGLFVQEIKITGQEGGLVSANLTLRQSASDGSN